MCWPFSFCSSVSMRAYLHPLLAEVVQRGLHQRLAGADALELPRHGHVRHVARQNAGVDARGDVADHLAVHLRHEGVGAVAAQVEINALLLALAPGSARNQAKVLLHARFEAEAAEALLGDGEHGVAVGAAVLAHHELRRGRCLRLRGAGRTRYQHRLAVPVVLQTLDALDRADQVDGRGGDDGLVGPAHRCAAVEDAEAIALGPSSPGRRRSPAPRRSPRPSSRGWRSNLVAPALRLSMEGQGGQDAAHRLRGALVG